MKVAINYLLVLMMILLGSVKAYAENPDTMLSKDDAKKMFAMSRSAWEENARIIKAARVGHFRITPKGQYTLYMRPALGLGLIIVTPFYATTRAAKPWIKASDKKPWKLSVTLAADEEPVLSLYRSMPASKVEEIIQIAARQMAPEYSVMGYMARNSKSAPSFHFTIFRAGVFPLVDRQVKLGKVCPPVGGKQMCVRSSLIE